MFYLTAIFKEKIIIRPKIYLLIFLNIFLSSEKNIFPAVATKKLNLDSIFAAAEETKEEETLLESPRKKQKKETEHELVESCPLHLFHATGSSFLFELGAHGGAPEGPAFFSTAPTRELYIDLYHRRARDLIRREINYRLIKKPRLAKLKNLHEEKSWVEKKLGIKIAEVQSGRGSIIDRYQKHKEAICRLYKSFAYDALIDEEHGSVVFFEPEKFLKIYAVEALGAPLRNVGTQEVILTGNHEKLRLYDLLTFIWSYIKLLDLKIYEEDSETLTPEGKKISKMIVKIVKFDPLSPLGFNQFSQPLFPLSKNFFTTQREGCLRKSEDLEDEIFSEKETFSWLRENFWNIIPLIETFIPKDFT